jgi:hypothetical protein
MNARTTSGLIVAMVATLFCVSSAPPEMLAHTHGDRALTDPVAPALARAYMKLSAQPGVFTTRGELADLA